LVSGLGMSFSRSAVSRTLGIIYVMNFVHHLVLKIIKNHRNTTFCRTGLVTFLRLKRWSKPTQLGPKGKAILPRTRPNRWSYSQLRLRLRIALSIGPNCRGLDHILSQRTGRILSLKHAGLLIFIIFITSWTKSMK
jgi:hypothetical protein